VLALRNITAEWSRAAKKWLLAMNQSAIVLPRPLRSSGRVA
jgi:hypothetical protein